MHSSPAATQVLETEESPPSTKTEGRTPQGNPEAGASIGSRGQSGSLCPLTRSVLDVRVLFLPAGKLRIRTSLLRESPATGSRQQAAEGEPGQAGPFRETITRASRQGSYIAAARGSTVPPGEGKKK